MDAHSPGRDESRRLLRSLDDPEAQEAPEGFDRAATAERFERCVGRLDVAFACTCAVDAFPSVQDASYFGHVAVPAEATRTGKVLFVRVSNFHPLVVWGMERPGVFTDAEVRDLLDGDDRRRVEDAIASVGYTAVSEDLLWEPCELNRDAFVGSSEGQPRQDWFSRFFDYL